MQHPLKLGSHLLSRQGEEDEDEDGTVRKTGPDAIGKIISVGHLPAPQGWSYGVVFEPSGVWVFIDEDAWRGPISDVWLNCAASTIDEAMRACARVFRARKL